jgi:hypothetical protein
VLVAGRRNEWESKNSAKWRSFHNSGSNIEIRSTDVFYDALEHYSKRKDSFWSFEENPVSLRPKDLEAYWTECSYIGKWRNILL